LIPEEVRNHCCRILLGSFLLHEDPLPTPLEEQGIE
jgi:hypothetical protein